MESVVTQSMLAQWTQLVNPYQGHTCHFFCKKPFLYRGQLTHPLLFFEGPISPFTSRESTKNRSKAMYELTPSDLIASENFQT